MDEQYRTQYHELEERHYWFRGRRDAILRRVAGLPKDSRILDVGCSSGILLEKLREQGYEHLYGIDISEESIAIARERGLQNVFVMDATRMDFPSGTFDVLISSDSLEHIEDDAAVAREFFRLLRPGGRLVLYVPAHEFLWSGHDVVNHHFRRYSRGRLKKLIEGAGLTAEQAGYWNATLFLPALLKRGLWDRLTGAADRGVPDSDLELPPAAVNRLLTRLLELENRWGLPGLPGLSAFVVARK